MTQRQLDLWMTPEAEVARAKGQCIPDRLHAPDVARMVLWLAADDSQLATAREFIIDGGWY
jgi:NAD(P)-dependent dehydrogenase (short-subunit alcohol dehydrogenase family)